MPGVRQPTSRQNSSTPDGYCSRESRSRASAAREILLIDDSPANTTAARAHGWQAHTFTGITALTDWVTAMGP
jgi:hypothetical protein